MSILFHTTSPPLTLNPLLPTILKRLLLENKMKSIYLALAFILATFSPLKAEETYQTAPLLEENLIDNKIYFFAHALCQNCKTAFIYLNTHHSGLNIPITDMKYQHNFNLYKQCVKKFNIKNQDLKLPLICMGNHYIMGWDNTSPEKFEQALKEFNTNAN